MVTKGFRARVRDFRRALHVDLFRPITIVDSEGSIAAINCWLAGWKTLRALSHGLKMEALLAVSELYWPASVYCITFSQSTSAFETGVTYDVAVFLNGIPLESGPQIRKRAAAEAANVVNPNVLVPSAEQAAGEDLERQDTLAPTNDTNALTNPIDHPTTNCAITTLNYLAGTPLGDAALRCETVRIAHMRFVP